MPISLKPFKPNEDYYSVLPHKYNHVFGEPIQLGTYVLLGFDGKALITNYYADEYGINIQNDIVAMLEAIITDIKYISEQSAKNKVSDVRKAFVIDDMIPGNHSNAVNYIRENNEEMIWFVNSISFSSRTDYLQFADALFKGTGISFYTTNGKFQTDGFSCHTMVLAISKDACRKDSKTGTYQIQNLMERLKERIVEEVNNHFYIIKMPDEFLKVSTYSNFTIFNKETTNRVVHHQKNETLDSFKQRYTLYVPVSHDKHVLLNDYPRQKGLKYAKIIEIQFYVEQMKQRMQNWDQYRALFIKTAKDILKQDTKNRHVDLYAFANALIDNPDHIIQSLSTDNNNLKTKP